MIEIILWYLSPGLLLIAMGFLGWHLSKWISELQNNGVGKTYGDGYWEGYHDGLEDGYEDRKKYK